MNNWTLILTLIWTSDCKKEQANLNMNVNMRSLYLIHEALNAFTHWEKVVNSTVLLHNQVELNEL